MINQKDSDEDVHSRMDKIEGKVDAHKQILEERINFINKRINNQNFLKSEKIKRDKEFLDMISCRAKSLGEIDDDL